MHCDLIPMLMLKFRRLFKYVFKSKKYTLTCYNVCFCVGCRSPGYFFVLALCIILIVDGPKHHFSGLRHSFWGSNLGDRFLFGPRFLFLLPITEIFFLGICYSVGWLND